MKWLKDYFDLSRKELSGFIALLSIIAILFALQFFIIYFVPDKKTDFSKLEKIASQLQSGQMDATKDSSNNKVAFSGPKKTLTTPVDLNTADSIKLMTIKGIGPTFAGRILAFRRRLGCFMNIDQLLDVQGIGVSKYGYLKPQACLSKGHPRYIHVNTDNPVVLMDNPYISSEMANAIVAYRKNHGRISSIEYMKRILAIDEQTFQKLKPYVAL